MADFSPGSAFAVDVGNYIPSPEASGFWGSAIMPADTAKASNTYIANKLEEDRLSSARDYETWFDSTKYQRAVKDLESAGLNKWLAVQSGVSGSGSANASSTNSAYKQSGKNKDLGTEVSDLLGSALKVATLVLLKKVI